MEIKKCEKLSVKEVLDLYAAVGWTNYSQHEEMLQRALDNSLALYAAYENQNLLGLIRLVGDGASIVFIQDLLIFPAYQRKGIGTALMKQALQDFKDVYQLHLLTDQTDKTKQFYQSLGFKPVDEMACRAFTYSRENS